MEKRRQEVEVGRSRSARASSERPAPAADSTIAEEGSLEEAAFLVEMRRLREAGIGARFARPAIDAWLRARAAGDRDSRLEVAGRKVRLVTARSTWDAGSGQGLLAFGEPSEPPGQVSPESQDPARAPRGVVPTAAIVPASAKHAAQDAANSLPDSRTLIFRLPVDEAAVASSGDRPGSSDGLFEQAVEAEETEPRRAMELYRALVDEDVTHVDAWVNLGRLLHQYGVLEEAESCYRAALEVRPLALAAFNLGVVLEDLDRAAEAREAYEGALGIDPEHADAWFNLSRLLEAAGDRPGALRSLQRYRRLVDCQ